MIKNKDEIIQEMKSEICEIIEKYGLEMDEGSELDRFPISSIEKMMENVMRDSKKVIVDRTSELINSIDEAKEIDKKKKSIK